MIEKLRIAVTTSGTAGSATGSTTSEVIVRGRILRVDVKYHPSAPATTDVTLTQTNELVSQSIVSLSNNNTDTVLYPRIRPTDNAGGDPLSGWTLEGADAPVEPYVVCDRLTASVSQSDALADCVMLEVYYHRE